MAATVTPSPVPHDVDVAALRRLLDGEHAAIRDGTRAWLSRPGSAPRPDLPMEEHRAQVLAWARELAEAGETAIGFPQEFGGRGQVGGSIAAFETLAFGDLSLLVKCGVQFGLFGGAVLHLGTRKHHEAHLSDITSLRLPGCFAMTETGHGSNVQQL
ncbi:MAG: acyl-CoA dehydrogenase protein, partial [Conexibacter sp.]|nr:acyl-CoA dehydrogenase protein [Conexibacter sp.]